MVGPGWCAMSTDRAHAPMFSAAKLDADLCALLPDNLKTTIVEFARHKCSGNVQINVVAGDIRGYHVMEMVRCSSKLDPGTTGPA